MAKQMSMVKRELAGYMWGTDEKVQKTDRRIPENLWFTMRLKKKLAVTCRFSLITFSPYVVRIKSDLLPLIITICIQITFCKGNYSPHRSQRSERG